jgi:hypothetical protein
MANRSRLRLLASVLLAAVVGGAATLLVNGSSTAVGASSAEYGAPTNTALPAVTGTPQVDSTLTTSNGTWSDSSATFTYAWNRCDAAGNTCTAIGGATASTYKLVAADLGHTIRSVVTAKNSSGSTSATSAPTGSVAPNTGPVAAANVVLPDRLVISKVSYSQNPIRARKTPTTMRVYVADTNNRPVQGALVFVQGIPYSRIANMAEVATDSTGWATLKIQPGPKFPRTGYITMMVRTRVSGQDILAGSSSRRLVQATIAAPNGT